MTNPAVYERPLDYSRCLVRHLLGAPSMHSLQGTKLTAAFSVSSSLEYPVICLNDGYDPQTVATSHSDLGLMPSTFQTLRQPIFESVKCPSFVNESSAFLLIDSAKRWLSIFRFSTITQFPQVRDRY